MASAGYHLTLVARREDRLQSVAERIGTDRMVEICPVDLGREDDLGELVARAEDAIGPIDVLVNNAGVEVVGRSHEVAGADVEQLMRVNLLAPVRLTGAVLPNMVSRGTGTIVDIASVAAYAHPPQQTFYSASKAALAAMSTSLRSELRKQGVHVLTVYPGPIRTEMSDRVIEVYPDGHSTGLPWGRADVLAQRIVKAIRRQHSTVVYPRIYWLPKLFPHLARLVIDASGRR